MWKNCQRICIRKLEQHLENNGNKKNIFFWGQQHPGKLWKKGITILFWGVDCDLSLLLINSLTLVGTMQEEWDLIDNFLCELISLPLLT